MRQSHPVAAAARPPARRVERPGLDPVRDRGTSPRTGSAAGARGAIVSVAEAGTTSGVSARRINFGNLDALRGLLAVYVALGHCRWLLWGGHAAWLATPHPAWEAIPVYASGALRYGREAVMVFFVLSGFFIHFRAAEAASREQFRAAPVLPAALASIGAAVFLRARSHAGVRSDRTHMVADALRGADRRSRCSMPPSLAAGIRRRRSCLPCCCCRHRSDATSDRTGRCGRSRSKPCTTPSIRSGSGFGAAAGWPRSS